MKNLKVSCWLIALVSLAGGVNALASETSPGSGYELFHYDWRPGDPNSPQGSDGLGPLYNATSCVACHNQGGSGGAGAAEHNVQLLTMTRVPLSSVPDDQKNTDAADVAESDDQRIYPALARLRSVVLHRYAWNPENPLAAPGLAGYAAMRDRLAARPSIVLTQAAIATLPKAPAMQGQNYGMTFEAMVRTERNTPALFGLGRIDKITNEILLSLAQRQRVRYPEVSGRPAGKFGWRGQIATLREFVLAACATELGLQTIENPQPTYPETPRNPNQTITPDMYDSQIDALVRYVSQLDPPREELPEGTPFTSWLPGGRLFDQARCAACHVERIGSVEGLYSDLLLHDMGPGLSDPFAASVLYYGTNRIGIASDEQKQEWRTPPLWGVRFSAPYLHDGRAETIEEAILLHGGEGTQSRQIFERLDAKERADLVAFVQSLGAPDPDER